jgi:hypothetical protein
MLQQNVIFRKKLLVTGTVPNDIKLYYEKLRLFSTFNTIVPVQIRSRNKCFVSVGEEIFLVSQVRQHCLEVVLLVLHLLGHLLGGAEVAHLLQLSHSEGRPANRHCVSANILGNEMLNTTRRAYPNPTLYQPLSEG